MSSATDVLERQKLPVIELPIKECVPGVEVQASRPKNLEQVLQYLEIAPFTTSSVRKYQKTLVRDSNPSFVVRALLRPIEAAFICGAVFTVASALALGISTIGWMYFLILHSALAAGFLTLMGPFLLTSAVSLVIMVGTLPTWGWKVGEWKRLPASKYVAKNPVPDFVTARIREITALCPSARFEVEYFVIDPFLLVRKGRFGRCRYIDVWTESYQPERRI